MRDDTKVRAKSEEEEEEEEGCKCEHAKKIFFFNDSRTKKGKRKHPLMWWWWMRTTKAFVLSLSLLNVFHTRWIIKKRNERTRRLSRFPLSRARWSIPRTSRVHSRIQSPRNPPTRSRRNSKRNTAYSFSFSLDSFAILRDWNKPLFSLSIYLSRVSRLFRWRDETKKREREKMFLLLRGKMVRIFMTRDKTRREKNKIT